MRKVEQLKRNYRMTKGVLEVGNAILRELKKFYPEAIEYAQPEVAMKDLGLSVILVDWKKAFKEKSSFGTNQAVIYAGAARTPDMQTCPVEEEIIEWLGEHPFILTALDAKGLEFDDVVVVFDLENAVWILERRKIASLRMLRELYVAVTRARRRVVILIKKSLPGMVNFFNSLDCQLDSENLTENTKILSLEFEKVTTKEMWFEKGTELFRNESWKVRCHVIPNMPLTSNCLWL